MKNAVACDGVFYFLEAVGFVILLCKISKPTASLELFLAIYFRILPQTNTCEAFCLRGIKHPHSNHRKDVPNDKFSDYT